MTDHWPHSPKLSDEPGTYIDTNGRTWRTDVLEATDWLGHRFRPGDKVMYCVAAGRGQMMAIGTVKAIRCRQYESQTWDRETQTHGKELRWEFEVQVLTTKTSGHWGNKQRTRPAWVNPMNITSVSGFVIDELASI